jgi:spore germination protein KC
MLEFAGLAVFRGDRLVGVLNAEEARAVAMLRGSFERAFISIPGPDQGGARIILDVRQGSPPHINIDLERETPHLSINLSLEADIVSAAGRDQRRPESLEALGRHAGEVLTGRVRDVLARAQEEFRADIFGFGRHAQARFGTWQSWLAYDWLDRFPLAEVEVKVDLRLRRVGLEFGELRPR